MELLFFKKVFRKMTRFNLRIFFKKKPETFFLFLIIFIGLGLRIYQLGEDSFWKDEIFSLTRSSVSLREIFFSNIAMGLWTPMHHFFIHLFLLFGKNEFWARLPSAIFGTASVLLFYLFLKEFFDKKIALIGSFLLSVSILHISFSQEARYYAYVIFFSLLSYYFLIRAVKTKEKKFFIFLFLANLLNLANHPTAFLVFSAQILFLIAIYFFKTLKSKVRFFFKKKYFLLLLILPLGVLTWIVLSFKSLFLFTKLSPAGSLFPFLEKLFFDFSGRTSVLTCLLVFFSLVGLFWAWFSAKRFFWLSYLLFFFPVLFFYFFRPQGFGFHVRYVSFALPVYLALVSLGINRLIKNRLLTIGVAVLILSLSFKPIESYYREEKEAWRQVADYLVKNANQEDVIMTEGKINSQMLGFYLDWRGKDLNLQTADKQILNRNIPFRIFYLQHDDLRERSFNSNASPISSFEKVISFLPTATVSPMFLGISKPIVFWQEAELNMPDYKDWQKGELWGREVMFNDLAEKGNYIFYKIQIEKASNYNFYLNLARVENLGKLEIRLDERRLFVNGDQFADKQNKIPTSPIKDLEIGQFFLDSGEHIVFFKTLPYSEGNTRQLINYFYLTE